MNPNNSSKTRSEKANRNATIMPNRSGATTHGNPNQQRNGASRHLQLAPRLPTPEIPQIQQMFNEAPIAVYPSMPLVIVSSQPQPTQRGCPILTTGLIGHTITYPQIAFLSTLPSYSIAVGPVTPIAHTTQVGSSHAQIGLLVVEPSDSISLGQPQPFTPSASAGLLQPQTGFFQFNRALPASIEQPYNIGSVNVAGNAQASMSLVTRNVQPGGLAQQRNEVSFVNQNISTAVQMPRPVRPAISSPRSTEPIGAFSFQMSIVTNAGQSRTTGPERSGRDGNIDLNGSSANASSTLNVRSSFRANQSTQSNESRQRPNTHSFSHRLEIIDPSTRANVLDKYIKEKNEKDRLMRENAGTQPTITVVLDSSGTSDAPQISAQPMSAQNSKTNEEEKAANQTSGVNEQRNDSSSISTPGDDTPIRPKANKDHSKTAVVLPKPNPSNVGPVHRRRPPQ